MKITIIGAGKLGVMLAKTLTAENHDITIIDINEDKVGKLVEMLDVQGISGSATHYDVLDEADSTVADNVALMRRQGFHFLLTGFGTEGFKMLKTAEFKVDNIMLYGSVAQVLGKSDRYDTCVNSLLNFVFDLNAEVIADGITDDKQVKQLSGMQCLYYSGENAGKYIAERYVRNRNE